MPRADDRIFKIFLEHIGLRNKFFLVIGAILCILSSCSTWLSSAALLWSSSLALTQVSSSSVEKFLRFNKDLSDFCGTKFVGEFGTVGSRTDEPLKT